MFILVHQVDRIAGVVKIHKRNQDFMRNSLDYSWLWFLPFLYSTNWKAWHIPQSDHPGPAWSILYDMWYFTLGVFTDRITWHFEVCPMIFSVYDLNVVSMRKTKRSQGLLMMMQMYSNACADPLERPNSVAGLELIH